VASSDVTPGGPYHEGELAVQERAAVGDMARRIGRGIRGEVPPAAAAFLRERRFAVLGWPEHTGGDGAEAPRVWASPLLGEPGFLSAASPRGVRVRADLTAGDPLAGRALRETDVGLVAIDFATRRRLRVNGVASGDRPGAFEVRTDQVYANCPKYIQARDLLPGAAAEPAGEPALSSEIRAAQADWIAAADTFFIATRHPAAGADASHRGGRPGFVRVADSGRALSWPDYAGNAMFQTLGNLAVLGRAGLLFIDFDTGSTLQLAGSAHIEWGPERRIDFRVERVVEIPRALPLRWRFIDASPFNP
jgi:uncharacterized protein